MTTSLFLDTQIRDWVLIPLFGVMFLVGILRANLMQLSQSDKTASVSSVREAQILKRARLLRANGNFIPVDAFDERINSYTNE
eukprot:Awhi_evm1s9259